MRIFMVAILLATSYLQCLGQERVNRTKLLFDGQSQILVEAIGWSNNSTLGEWIDYKNFISNKKEYKALLMLQQDFIMSLNSQNFKNIQTKTITFNNNKYYILIVTKWGGRYKYPALKEDWYPFENTIGYIYTEQEYKKIENIDKIVALRTKKTVTIGNGLESYNETKFLDLIQTELMKEEVAYGTEYSFVVTKSKEGMIRFVVPDSWNSYYNYDFEKKYFETDNANFAKILIK